MESSRQSGQRVSERLTTAERRHNLPELLTALVGRERDVVEVAQRLGTTRLLSLIGAGGIGKTRLALSVGIEVVPRYPAGVWLVELASLTDPTTIPRAIAASLGVYEEPARELTTTIADAVRSRGPLLLILDNCEHLIVDVAIIVDRLLRACPGLTILATSREALGITGETAWRVPSLLLPPDPLPIGADAVATLAEHGAARLFLDRARDVQADFVVSEQNAHVIIQICRRLDGIPLAIELAAARARVLTPRQIAARLDDRFRLLTDSSRTADSRQRTLRSTIDWSYTLLSGAERVVLQRLSVFAGGCTLEAIEAICRDDADPIPDDVLDLVTRLADRSLVVVDLSGAEARYRLLETIRAYAVERLEASGEAERIRQRHAGYFLTLAELAGPQVRFADGRRWLDQLQFEHENLHAALARGAGAFDDRNLMPRMAGALWWYWHARGHLTEGRHWLGQALDVVVDPAVRLTVLYGAGTLAFHQDDYPQARECALESVALGRATGDQRAVAWALARLGIIARRVGDLEQAMAYCDEGLGLSRQLGDAETIAHTLIACGQVVRGLGDYEQADSYWEECLQLARVAGQTLFQSQTLVFRAAAAVVLGDLDRAETLCSEALALIRQREDRFQQIHPLEILVRVAKQRADVDRVAGLARDIGGGYSELGNRGGVALAASALAWVAHVCGDGPRAARLLGASDAVIAASGRVRTPGVIK